MRGPHPRSFGWLAALLAAFLLAPAAGVLAQDATPGASPVASPGASPAASPGASPAALGETIRSQTREQFRAEIAQAYEFEEPQRRGGTYIASAVADIQTLNPLLAEEEASLAVNGLIYDQLVGGDPRTGQPAPSGLADSWEVAPDGLTYTFKLNTEAKWHDGVDVTAEDVEFSFDAIADERTGSAYTGSFVNAVASYRVVDPDTFEVVAKEPLFTFLYDLVTWIVPKHVWESVPFENWASDPGATGQDPSRVVGTGAFRFGEWKQGESVTLSRNDEYYDVIPNIDSYVFRVWPDQTAVVNALINGEIDIAGLEAADVASVEGTEGITIESYETRGFSYIEYNLDPAVTTLFQDRAVRQALFHAIDRESIVNDILLGYGTVARGTQPTISYAYNPDAIETEYTFDPERGRQLLTEAGWTDTNGNGTVDKAGQELEFEYLYPSGSPTGDQTAAYIQDAWAEIGVRATPRSLEFPALIEATTTNPTYQVAQYAFSWDATFIQDAMFGCAQYQVGFNDMRYCNPELDAINQRARTEFDEAARAELLAQAANIVNEDVPVMITHFTEDIVGYSSRLHNYFPGPWGGPGIQYIWIEE
ncbi:MAG: ABC transporter, substrate-binding protein (cluster 5, nickel/peptides/opines) [uncultured Thermomicrobiales bacterium]|uniref:ABC transporter, substrate-binding protein (Cluster 5, nickel/peptides/opines) n=1 Tax=uncultured Thermomicrobiales bacterium TaxID=1645740 RepID=A0A6J4V2N5_9BACT|nr:MAG: ABC transporter, substrate-binding protein (cluster 5, nickel/peptides/opines) [uncultured Thermomicrobiales bacterium]